MLNSELKYKLDTLKDLLHGYGRVLVAFSGGVDSSLLLKVALDVLGSNAKGIFCNSRVIPSSEVESAFSTASYLGTKLLVVPHDILQDHTFCANPANRCYVCKKTIYEKFQVLQKEHRFSFLLDGTNVDDNDDLRPGSQAVKEYGVKTPLRAAGFTKKNIRAVSKELGLHSWNKFSSSCLATRVGTGITITEKKLEMIEKGEQILIGAGFPGCRLKLYEEYAVVELVEGDHIKFVKNPVNSEIKEFLENQGLGKVLLDLSGRVGNFT